MEHAKLKTLNEKVHGLSHQTSLNRVHIKSVIVIDNNKS